MKEIQVAGKSKYEVLEDVAGDVIDWLKSVKLWKGKRVEYSPIFAGVRVE
jgi:hypothetical protein